MNHHRSSIALLAVSLAGSACASGEAGDARAVRTDSAGIALVVNDSIDRPLDWRFEERFAVGGAKEGPEAFFGLWEAGVGVDSLDRLYVLDAGNYRIVVFDNSGTLLRTQGAQGGGPGEFQFPGNLVVRESGEVGVYDFSRGGLVPFAADGSPLPVVRVGRAEGGPPLDRIRPIAGGLVTEGTDRSESGMRSRLVVTLDTAETELIAVDRPRPPMHMYRSCSSRLGMSLPPLFEPSLQWAVRGDRVAAATGATYVVDVYEGGRLARSIRRRVSPVPATIEMARRELGEGMPVRFGGGQCTIDPDELIEARGLAPTLPAVRSIVLAPDSTLWIERGRLKDDPSTIDVFSAEGEYLGTLPPGSPMPAAFMSNGDVVSIATDELDVQRVVVHRVLRDGAAGR